MRRDSSVSFNISTVVDVESESFLFRLVRVLKFSEWYKSEKKKRIGHNFFRWFQTICKNNWEIKISCEKTRIKLNWKKGKKSANKYYFGAMDHASAGFTSPWAAAVHLSQHAMNPTNIEHGFGHHGLTMDYSYYRCGWILCFSFSKIIFKLGRVVFFVFLCHTLTLLCSFFWQPEKKSTTTITEREKRVEIEFKFPLLLHLCEEMRHFSRLFTWRASTSLIQ